MEIWRLKTETFFYFYGKLRFRVEREKSANKGNIISEFKLIGPVTKLGTMREKKALGCYDVHAFPNGINDVGNFKISHEFDFIST